MKVENTSTHQCREHKVSGTTYNQWQKPLPKGQKFTNCRVPFLLQSMLNHKCSLTRDFIPITLIVGERGPQVLEKVVWRKYFVTDCRKFRRSFTSGRPDVFCKKGFLKSFPKFAGKHLCQSIFFNKVAGLTPVTLLKKGLWLRSFLWILQNF